MNTNFETVINRKNTKSAKYDGFQNQNVPEEAIPMWVADMDFMVPLEVQEDLIKTANHGIFGYSGPDKNYEDAVLGWMEDHFGYKPDSSEMLQTPGVVFAIAHAVKAFTEPGDGVLIQPPVYYPFKMVTEANGRVSVPSPLIEKDGVYSIDFEDFEKQAAREDVKLFILCNPHNPVGRVFTEDELRKMAQICIDNDVLIVSDEIHSDFIHGDNKHIMLPTLSEEIAENTILATAPSKTFNLAGLQGSNIFIKNEELREKYKKTLQASGAGSLNIFAYNACQSAYKNGREWVKELNAYIEENFSTVKNFLEENIPEIKTQIPEGTYLMWLDCRELGMNDDELKDFFLNKAHLWLDEGTFFGPEGSGFMRINVAAPKSTVEQALNQLKAAVDDFKQEKLKSSE